MDKTSEWVILKISSWYIGKYEETAKSEGSKDVKFVNKIISTLIIY